MRRFTGLVWRERHDGVEGGVDPVDRCELGLHHLSGRDLSVSDQPSQRGGRKKAQVRHWIGVVRPSGGMTTNEGTASAT